MFNTANENSTAVSDLSNEVFIITSELKQIGKSAVSEVKRVLSDKTGENKSRVGEFVKEFEQHTNSLLLNIDEVLGTVDIFENKSDEYLSEEPEIDAGEELSTGDEEDLETLKKHGFEALKLENNENRTLEDIVSNYGVMHDNFIDWGRKFRELVENELNYSFVNKSIVDTIQLIMEFVGIISISIKSSNEELNNLLNSAEQ